MISKEDIVNYLIDLSVNQDYLDMDNEVIDKIAVGVYQRVVSNDTVFFSLPMTDTVMTHSIDDAPIRRAITMVVNTSKLAMGNMPALEFAAAKKNYFTATAKMALDNPINVYNLLKNINRYYEEEVFSSLTSTGLLDTLYKNSNLLEKLNESALSRGVITEEKDAEYYEAIKNKLPNVYLLWAAHFFSVNQEYFTDALVLKMIEKANKRNMDLSYYFDVFINLDEEVEDDLDELTEDEIEFLI